MLNVKETVNKEAERIDSMEEMLGKGLMQPFSNTNSAVRKILHSNQLEQEISLMHPEPPVIQTGYEDRFGELSSSIVRLKHPIEVIDKICKFKNRPNDQYYLVYRDLETGEFDVFHRIGYCHYTEEYGFLYNNDLIDKLDIGYEVPKGTIIRKSNAYDEYMNRCDGVNLITGYVNTNKSMEDAILISESAAKKLASPFIKRVEVSVNDNDLLLNLFGDSTRYKSYPDIGEYVPNGILCATRREKTEECLYMQSIQHLETLLISDTKYTVTGQVIDIDVYCNNPEDLLTRVNNTQVKKYYDEHRRMIREIIECVDRIKEFYSEASLSYRLQELYDICKKEENLEKFVLDKPFSGTILVFHLLEENLPKKGDKITNRYGGKGVVVPDDNMPVLDNGKRMEVCFNGFTCINRLNWGQLGENSLTFIGSRILDYISENRISTADAIDMIYKYISFVSKPQADMFMDAMYGDGVMPEDRDWYIDQMINEGYIIISHEPISESINLDKLAEMYQAFPFIKPYRAMSQIKDSNGNLRWVPSRRTIVCGYMYIYRLKQYAQEKFSVTSLSSTNIKNENTRNKANKAYRAVSPNTPIRFGDMETGNLLHMGVEYVISTLMIHSLSPEGRRLVKKMLTGDPYHVDIQLDSKSKNRNAEILNTYLKTRGLRIVFEKRKKKLEPMVRPILVRPIHKPKLERIAIPIHPEDMEYVKSQYFIDKRERERIEGEKHMVRPYLVKEIKRKDRK